MGPINNVYIRALLNARNNARKSTKQAQDYGDVSPYLSGDPASGVIPFYEPNPDPYANLDRGPFQPSQPQYQPARPAMGVDALADIPVEMRRDPYAPVRYNAPPLPEMPSLRTPPARNIGYERKQEGKTALRAGLIGLLLGGGAGALAAATGASQGFQQGADRGYGIDYTDWANQSNLDRQQYDMAMRDYEAQSRQAQTQLGVDQTNRSLDAAANAEDIARERAAADQRMKILDLAPDFAPESQAPMLAYGEGRAGFPEGGLKPYVRPPSPDSGNTLSLMVDRWIKQSQTLSPEEWTRQARERNAALDANPNVPDYMKAMYRYPLTKVPTDTTLNRLQRAEQFRAEYEFKGKQFSWQKYQDLVSNSFRTAEQAISKARLSIDMGRNRIDGLKPAQDAVSQYNTLYDSILALRAKQYEPKARGESQPAYETRIAEVKDRLSRYDTDLKLLSREIAPFVVFPSGENMGRAVLRRSLFDAPKPTPKPKPAAPKADSSDRKASRTRSGNEYVRE